MNFYYYEVDWSSGGNLLQDRTEQTEPSVLQLEAWELNSLRKTALYFAVLDNNICFLSTAV